MPTTSLVEEYEKGILSEHAVLDGYFQQWYQIRPATLQQEKDERFHRLFRPKGSDRDAPWTKVEYRTDDRTDRTGNLFIETWSSVELRRYGWGFTSRADIVIYYAVPDTVYILDRREMQEELLYWIRRYRTVEVDNGHDTTQGIAVPVHTVVEMIGENRVRRIS